MMTKPKPPREPVVVWTRPHRADGSCWCRPHTGRDRYGRVYVHHTPKTEEPT